MAADVVLVPGFMQSAAGWSDTVARIGRSYRAEALDHLTSDFEGRLGEIEAAAAPRAVLLGYSLGGRLALHAALRAPGRYGALVTVGASAGIDDPAARETRRAADEELAAWIERQPIEAVVGHWERNPALVGQPPELVAAQRADRLAHEPAQLAGLLRSAGKGALEPVWDRLETLTLPVLALAGERDAPYVAAAERIARTAPNARAASIADAGHAAHLEQPAAFSALLGDFLDEHLGERRLVDRDA